MSQGFGGQVPAPHVQAEHRQVTTYLVIIAAPEGPIAKLLLPNLEQVAELDANTEEVTTMIAERVPAIGAAGAEWDRLFAAYSAEERATAKIYTLDT